MLIKTITLANFRNHTKYHLECKPTTTLIIGANGCGKTSVLEAIYILTRGKSFRSTDPEIIKHGAPFYRIELEYNSGIKTTAIYDGKAKTFLTSDKKTRRLPKNSRYPVVLFEPSDLNLITGSPSRHRDYFNRYFGGISEEYASSVSRYDKALRQRNELLKSELCSSTSLFSWNLLLAKYGTTISRLRAKYTTVINQELTKVYRSIAENSDEVNLNLITEVNVDLTESSYLKTLERNQPKDQCIGHTTFGIHKDDFEFIFNGKKASGSASRGETRSVMLALKFIEADTLEQTTGEKPIILLDDVFSELDETRRKALVNNFKTHQVIITSVEK